MRRHRPLLLIISLLTPLVAASADLPEIQRALKRAEAHIRNKDCEAALREMAPHDAALRARGDLRPFRWNFAWCLEQTGRYAEAAESYEQFIALDGPDRERALARRRLATLETEKLGRLELSCRPDDATARLDAHATDPRPCPASYPRLPAGTHTVTLRAPSGLETTQPVDVPPGRTTTTVITVPAEVTLHSLAAGVRVQLDGRTVGDVGPDAPLTLRDVQPGRRHLRATHPKTGEVWESRRWIDGGEQRLIEIPLRAPDDETVTAPPAASTDDGTSPWLWVGIGTAAAVGIGVGAWLLLADDEAAAPRQASLIGEVQ